MKDYTTPVYMNVYICVFICFCSPHTNIGPKKYSILEAEYDCNSNMYCETGLGLCCHSIMYRLNICVNNGICVFMSIYIFDFSCCVAFSSCLNFFALNKLESHLVVTHGIAIVQHAGSIIHLSIEYIC